MISRIDSVFSVVEFEANLIAPPEVAPFVGPVKGMLAVDNDASHIIRIAIELAARLELLVFGTLASSSGGSGLNIYSLSCLFCLERLHVNLRDGCGDLLIRRICPHEAEGDLRAREMSRPAEHEGKGQYSTQQTA